MDEIYALISKAQNGDEAAKERIVKENSGLIWSVAKKFKNRGYDAEDLYQIGAIGLLKCIEKFDVGFKVKFSTYAVPMIMGEIKRFLRDDGLIKVSRPLKELAVKAGYAREAFLSQTNREPTVEELAKNVGASAEELVFALEASKDAESIYKTVYRNDGSSVYLIDKLSSENDEEQKTDILAIKEALNRLEPRDRQIIILRYFEDRTQTQTAEFLGISQVQVSRAEKRILETIRKSIAE